MTVLDEARPGATLRRPLGRLTKIKAPSTPLYRNGLALVLNSGITSLLGTAYWGLAARLTTPQLVGVNAALVSALAALANASQLGLGGGLATYLPRAGQGAASLVRRGYVVAVLASLILAGAFVTVAPRMSPALQPLRRTPLALFFVGSVAAWSIFSLQDNVLTGLRRAVWVPLENIAYSTAKIVLVVLLAGSWAGYGIFVSWTLPAALALAPVSVAIFTRFIPVHIRAKGSDPQPAPTMPFQRFVAGDSVGMLLAQVSTTLLPMLVATRAGAAAAGHFYIPWMLAQSLDLVAVNIGMSLTVEGAHAANEVRPMLRGVLKRMLLVVAVLAAIGGLAAPLLLQIFGGEYAHGSVTILRLLLIGSLFRAVLALSICGSRAELAAKRIVGLQAALVAIVPTSAWILMGRFHATGAAMAWLIGQAAVAPLALRSMGWLRTKVPTEVAG